MDRTLIEAYESVLNPNNATDHIRCILPLINIMLTVSPATAECEIGFSLINGLKTQNRTSNETRQFKEFNENQSCLSRV